MGRWFRFLPASRPRAQPNDRAVSYTMDMGNDPEPKPKDNPLKRVLPKTPPRPSPHPDKPSPAPPIPGEQT